MIAPSISNDIMAFKHQKNYSAADERRYTQIKRKTLKKMEDLRNRNYFLEDEKPSAFICGKFIFFPPYKHICVHLRQIFLFPPYKHIRVHLRLSAANFSFIFAPFSEKPFGKYLSHFLA
jgi:hypothetical protein